MADKTQLEMLKSEISAWNVWRAAHAELQPELADAQLHGLDLMGAYLDRAGTPMLEGGGTELQKKIGRYVGPGGQEPVKTPGGDALIYHYYDGDDSGTPKLQVAPISWSDDGWPELAPPS